MKKKHKLNQKGQTFISILMLMILALLIGVSVSNRFVSSLRSYIGTDDSAKALGVAEAAVERILLLPNETLEDYINFGSCGSDCYLQITDETGRILTATVTLSFEGNSSADYNMSLNQGQTSQLQLGGYGSGQPLDVCWNNDASIYAVYVYDDGSEDLADIFAHNSITTSHPENNFDTTISNHGYNSCFSITAQQTPKLLRVRPFYHDTTVYIVPAPGQNIPQQGILIESVGVAGNINKIVRVVKSDPILPAMFDYVIYQKSLTSPLSN